MQLCYSVLWRRRRAAGVLLKFLIAGTAGLWKCQEGSDREDLTNTWGLVDSLLSFPPRWWVDSEAEPGLGLLHLVLARVQAQD